MKHRHAFVLFAVVYVIFFAPVIFRGEVIFPHNNDTEVGLPPAPDPARISNRKFADESNVFIPEINFLLNGRHRAWIGTWNPDTELGRPSQQLALGKAYLPVHILTFFTDDPFLLYTLAVLMTVFLSGLFMFLLMKSLDLAPLACLVAACSVSFGVYFTYWLTFNVFLTSFCWALGLMWASRLFIRKRSAPLALCVAFFSYSLFMTAYPQSIVLQAYLMVGFALVLLWKSEGALKKKALTAVMLGGAALLGALLTAPLYMDLLENASRSARLGAENAFLLRNMPRIHGFGELLIYVHVFFDAFIFGNPIRDKSPMRFDGLSFTPLYSALFFLTFIRGQWRRLWPWQTFILLCIIGTAWPAAHLFAIKYLGFRFSATNYLGGSLIPAAILAAYAVDYLVCSERGGAQIRKAVTFLPIVPAGLLLLIYGDKLVIGPSVFYLSMDLAIIFCIYILAVLPSRTLRAWGILGLTLLTVFVYGLSLRLIRPEAKINTTSRVIEYIREQTEGGRTRLAFVGYKKLIPPNQESLLGLKSIHAYDSLSSREYQLLVKKMSARGTYTRGRHFDYITDGRWLERPEFSYAGIGLYISSMDLQKRGLVPLGRWRQYRFYRPVNPPLMSAQVMDYEQTDKGIELAGRLEDHSILPVRRLDAYTDYKTFALSPRKVPSLLFMSEQYHPRWKARSKTGPLRTVKVNDFYEGVIIPPQTGEVVLEFRPLVIYMWVPQLVFVLLGLTLLVRHVVSRRKGTAA